MTVGETARCRQCPGTGEQKLGAIPHGRCLWGADLGHKIMRFVYAGHVPKQA